MSDAAGTPVFRATFNSREGWAECDDVRHEGRAGGWIVAPLCKLLVAADHPDGILEFYDAVSGNRHFWIKSIHQATADRPEPKVGGGTSKEQIEAPKPRGRQVTASIEDRILFVPVNGEMVRVTPKQREAFNIIRHAPTNWEPAVNAKTRNWLEREQWVTVTNGKPAFTELGRQVEQATRLEVAKG